MNTFAQAAADAILTEAEAVKFLKVSRMTLIRNRKKGALNYYRVGIRVLYSKERHLLPFLAAHEGIEGESYVQ